MESLIKGENLASLADLMGHESVETTKSFYALFEQDDLRCKHEAIVKQDRDGRGERLEAENEGE
jgi:hypothetical protein